MKRRVFNIASVVSLLLIVAWPVCGVQWLPDSVRIIVECWPLALLTVLSILPLLWMANWVIRVLRYYGAPEADNGGDATKRRLLTTAWILSLVLCAATVALWVRSYWATDTIERRQLIGNVSNGEVRFFSGSSYCGGIEIARTTAQLLSQFVPSTTAPQWCCVSGYFQGGPYLVEFSRPLRRFQIGKAGSFSNVRDRAYMQFPHWFLALLLASPSALPIYRRFSRQRRRIAAGQCDRCGYDLRATKDRCPECGSPVPAGHVAKVNP